MTNDKANITIQLFNRTQWFEPGSLSKEPIERTWLVKDSDDGIIPLGEVGLVVGAGGTSKTYLMISLVISVALGRPWLGRFTVSSPGSCAIFLAEESFEECHRRFYYVCKSMGLTADERTIVERHVLCAPLAGIHARLLEDEDRRPHPNSKAPQNAPDEEEEALTETDAVATAIGNYLHREARGPWRLIVFDSLSRFSSKNTEKDNAAGADFINILERFTTLKGNPTVACVHHTNLSSRSAENRDGPLNPRGVSVLHDNCRWVVTLHPQRDPTRVAMRVAKSNYGPTHPIVPEVTMQRGDHGALTVVDDAVLLEEREAAAAERAIEDEDVVFREVQRHPLHHKTKTHLAKAVGGRLANMLKAADRLIEDGRIIKEKDGFRTSSYHLEDLEFPE